MVALEAAVFIPEVEQVRLSPRTPSKHLLLVSITADDEDAKYR